MLTRRASVDMRLSRPGDDFSATANDFALLSATDGASLCVVGVDDTLVTDDVVDAPVVVADDAVVVAVVDVAVAVVVAVVDVVVVAVAVVVVVAVVVAATAIGVVVAVVALATDVSPSSM